MKTVLHIAHNHPSFHAGGTEIFAKGLSDYIHSQGVWNSYFLSAALPHYATPHPGTNMTSLEDQPRDLILTGGHFDYKSFAQIDSYGFLREYERLLEHLKPDVIHVHHLLMFGSEALAIAKRIRPTARIIMTLHDMYPICVRDGQMRKGNGTLCDKASAKSCTLCSPEFTTMQWQLRNLHIRQALEFVSHFVTPSIFLRNRYLAWGIPEDKISYVANGHVMAHEKRKLSSAGCGREKSETLSVGFFGHMNDAKGGLVLLRAAQILKNRQIHKVHIHCHGSDQYASDSFKEAFHTLLSDLQGHVTFHGPYEQKNVLSLMENYDCIAVPSVWWENDPLVIQEAYLANRPVLASNIGGMAENVIHGQSGWHVPVNDPYAWAEMFIAFQEQSDRLEFRIPDPRPMATCANAYLDLYETDNE